RLCGPGTLSRPMKGCWHLPVDRRKVRRSRRSNRQRCRPTSSADRRPIGFLPRVSNLPARIRAAPSCTGYCRARHPLDADPVSTKNDDGGKTEKRPRILDERWDGKTVFTVEEAGVEILRLSRPSAFAAASNGTLPTVRIGRRLLVPRHALERMLAGE